MFRYIPTALRAAGGGGPKARKGIAGVSALILACSGLTFATAPAHAVTGEVSDLKVSVAQDGTAPFSVKDNDGKVLDDGPDNGIAPSNDKIRYTVKAWYRSAGDVTFKGTLPDGMRWDATSKASTVCDGADGGTISKDYRTLTCSRDVEDGTSTESFTLTALTTDVANGSKVTPTITADGVTATLPDDEQTTVVGVPKLKLSTYTEKLDYKATVNGQPGFSWNLRFTPGLDPDDMRGSEAIKQPIDIKLEVGPGIVVTGNTGDAGTTYSQPDGAGTPITVHLKPGESQGDFVEGNVSTPPANLATGRKNMRIGLGVPYGDDAPAGQQT